MIQLTVLQLISIIISFFSLGFSICHLLYIIFNKIFIIDEGKSADEIREDEKLSDLSKEIIYQKIEIDY